METQQEPGIFTAVKVKSQAHAAALSHGYPARKLQVILVIGQDGARQTIAYLTAMLSKASERVGVIAQTYVEIAGERAPGSDRANVLGEAFRLHGLLAQMRKARCKYVIIEAPATITAHQFTAIKPSMIIVRRCGDSYLDTATIASRVATIQRFMADKPDMIVANRDDPCFKDLKNVLDAEQKMTFGTHAKAECRITQVEMHPKGSSVDLLIDHQTELHLVSELTGKQAIYSAVAAAAAAYLLHVPITAIEEGVTAVEPLQVGLQYVPVQRPYQMVLDASFTPEGVAETLETLKHFAKNRLIVMASSPLGQLPAWRPVVGEIIANTADRVVITDGEYIASESQLTVREQLLQGVIATGGEAKTDEVPDRRTAIEKTLSIARRGDIIVLCGVTNRPYRQLGSEHVPWNDTQIIEELIGA